MKSAPWDRPSNCRSFEVRDIFASARLGVWETLSERTSEEATDSSEPFFAVIPIARSHEDGSLNDTIRQEVRQLMQDAIGFNIVGM